MRSILLTFFFCATSTLAGFSQSSPFTLVPSSLKPMEYSSCAWGDYDNDGNIQFTDIAAPLIPLQTASCSWVDYKNDGQLDVLISGDSVGGMITRLYRNNHGIFTPVNVGPAPFMGLSYGRNKWADMDNDGWKDLVLSGMDMDAIGHLVVYRNMGNDQFELYDNMTSNVRYSSIDIADYDADGYQDIILIGKVPGIIRHQRPP